MRMTVARQANIPGVSGVRVHFPENIASATYWYNPTKNARYALILYSNIFPSLRVSLDRVHALRGFRFHRIILQNKLICTVSFVN